MHISKSVGASSLAVLLLTITPLGMPNFAFAAEATYVPFKATFSGNAYFTSETTAEFHGTGAATHLGQSMNFGILAPLIPMDTNECEAGWGIPHTNTETLTAANGDLLVLEMNDLACPTSTPNVFEGTGFWNVIYGTGRFADAKGWGAVKGGGDFNLGIFKITMIGEIAY